MNRLYAVDCTPTLTGAKADHRLATTPEGMWAVAAAVARRLGIDVGAEGSEEPSADWVDAAVADLRRASGAGGAVVLAGPYQPAEVHALVHAINDRLGAAGKSVVYVEPLVPVPKGSEQDPGPNDSLRRLVSAAKNGEVETLVIVGGNPAYEVPPDVGFAEALAKVPNAVHLSLYEDETSRLCRWHVPGAHFLEAWGDARGHDGTATIVQPLIEPLYGSLSDLELVALLAGRTESAHDLVRETWRERLGEDVERGWHEFLRKGVLADTAAEPVAVTVADDVGRRAVDGLRKRRGSKGEAQGLSVAFRLAPTVWDGRYANNGWLQELPNPLTKLTWGNAALMSVADAAANGVEDGDVVAVRRGEAQVELPAYRVPGHPEGVVTLHLGYGRRGAGRVAAEAVGADVNPLRAAASPWFAAGTSVTKTGGKVSLAATQGHFRMEGKNLARGGTLAELQEKPDEPGFVRDEKHGAALAGRDTSLYPDWKYPDVAWGMAIDLTTCTGCQTCVVACQAENNIPVVGRAEVLRHRAMHWIRIDVYYEGPPESPTHVRQQPVPCMHCELAPCEPVCPVAATVHGGSGLNEMVYNRCIGTRYCSNNCPYKVRRFNFLAYSERFHTDPVLKLLPNPDVTVRSRGVMEKCNYCVQRIEEATIAAKREKRAVRDGEVVPACAQACPTTAIVFGDLNDKGSAASKLKASPLNYAMLEELNTRPRTTYLAEVRNPREGLGGALPDGRG
jgi:molybdopterin-containing oxidoreductase family iron-sulfur binding subunit